jgi:hypothetical protein
MLLALSFKDHLDIDDLIEILEKRASGCLVFLDQLQHELSSIPVELEQDSEFTADQGVGHPGSMSGTCNGG